MLTNVISYHRPASVEQALEWLAGDLPGAVILAGGTQLLTSGGSVEKAIDITRLGLDTVEDASEGLIIGACCTLQRLLDWGETRIPSTLVQAAGGEMGHLLRNAATVGGCLVGERAPQGLQTALLALGATVEVRTLQGARWLPVHELLSPQGAILLAAGGLITRVQVPHTGNATRTAFERCAITATDTSIMAAAAQLRLEDGKLSAARVAVGCFGPYAVRLPSLEAHLLEHSGAASAEVLAEALAPLAFREDVRASASYRAHLAHVLVKRCLARVAIS